MLFNDLSFYLKGVITPEAAAVFIDAANLLTAIDDPRHETAIDQILSLVDDAEDATTIMNIEQVLTQLLLSHLQDHGITIIEPNLAVLTSMVEAIVSLDQYGDPLLIVQSCDAGESPEVILSEILALKTQYGWADYLGIIGSVNQSLITRIRDNAQTQADNLDQENEEPENPLLPEIRVRLKRFLVDHPSIMIRDMIAEGMPLGLGLETYVSEKHSVLSNLPPEAAAIELVGMAYASSLLVDQIKPAINEQMEGIFAEVSQLTKAEVTLRKVLGA